VTDAELIATAVDPVGIGTVLRARGLELEARVIELLCTLPKPAALKAIARVAGDQQKRGRERSAVALTWTAMRLAKYWHPRERQALDYGRMGPDGPRPGELVGEATRALLSAPGGRSGKRVPAQRGPTAETLEAFGRLLDAEVKSKPGDDAESWSHDDRAHLRELARTVREKARL
jgi:hypothetical protein